MSFVCSSKAVLKEDGGCATGVAAVSFLWRLCVDCSPAASTGHLVLACSGAGALLKELLLDELWAADFICA